MAKFSKTYSIPSQTSDKIFEFVSNDIERFLSKTPLTGVQIDRDASSKKVSFKSSMASGDLCAVDSGLKIDIELSFLATPFKGKLEEGIQKWISKTFGA